MIQFTKRSYVHYLCSYMTVQTSVDTDDLNCEQIIERASLEIKDVYGFDPSKFAFDIVVTNGYDEKIN